MTPAEFHLVFKTLQSNSLSLDAVASSLKKKLLSPLKSSSLQLFELNSVLSILLNNHVLLPDVSQRLNALWLLFALYNTSLNTNPFLSVFIKYAKVTSLDDPSFIISFPEKWLVRCILTGNLKDIINQSAAKIIEMVEQSRASVSQALEDPRYLTCVEQLRMDSLGEDIDDVFMDGAGLFGVFSVSNNVSSPKMPNVEESLAVAQAVLTRPQWETNPSTPDLLDLLSFEPPFFAPVPPQTPNLLHKSETVWFTPHDDIHSIEWDYSYFDDLSLRNEIRKLAVTGLTTPLGLPQQQ
ncbi:hypothetical protein HK096_009640, partial [Nowakowskiella sp. JEL0078]